MLGFRPIASAPIASLAATFITISEVITVSEDLDVTGLPVHASASGTIVLTEDLDNFKIANRPVSDTEALTEGVTTLLDHAYGIDVVSVTEILSPNTVLNRSLSDSMSLAESVETHGIVVRLLSDDVIIQEVIYTPKNVVLSETLFLGETIVGTLLGAVPEALLITESAVVSKIASVNLTETITLTESSVRLIFFDILENIAITEGWNAIHIFDVRIAEGVSLGEGTLITSFLRKVQEAISPIETLTVSKFPQQNLTESITLTEISFPHSLPTLIDTFEFVDVGEDVSFDILPVLYVEEDIALYETIQLNYTLNLLVCDCLILSEHLRITAEVIVSDTLTITELADANPLNETIHLVEMVVTNAIYSGCCTHGYVPDKGLTDNMSVTEGLELIKMQNFDLEEDVAVENTVAYLP